MLRALSLCALVLVAGCRSNPLEETTRLVASGRCSEAMDRLDELSARGDRWGRAARTLRARCAVDLIREDGSATTQSWSDAVRLLREALEEASESDLPGGVEPIRARELGQACERLMDLYLRSGSHEQVTAVMEDNADLAEYGWRARSLTGTARIALGQWARAAADLDSGAAGAPGDEERARLLRLAAGAWHLAGQEERALVDFCRAHKTHPLDWRYPERLIPEGQEMEHVLGELIAAAVHGILMQGFTRDWEVLQDEPQKFNFFLSEKRHRAFLDAAEEIEAIEVVIISGEEGQLADAAPRLLYQILNMRGLYRAAGGDYAGAREDLERALEVDPDGAEAATNLGLLAFWTWDRRPTHTKEVPR